MSRGKTRGYERERFTSFSFDTATPTMAFSSIRYSPRVKQHNIPPSYTGILEDILNVTNFNPCFNISLSYITYPVLFLAPCNPHIEKRNKRKSLFVKCGKSQKRNNKKL